MQLPSLVPGQRYTLPRPPGAADALLIAHLASARAAQGQLTLVVCAEPADSQRLADELPFFAPHLRIAVFPDWETLPYDQFSPHQDLVSERLATLWRLYRKSQGLGSANTGVAVAAAKGKAAPDPTKSVNANKEDDEGVDVVILPASTALTRLAPPSFLAATTFNFKQKSRLDEAALRAQLTLAGYSHVSSVVSPGEYAVRGGLIDLFPMGSNVPYRVDLFDNEVDSIRTFDPDTQRSLYPVPQVRLLPGREFALDEASRKAFRVRWRERIEGDPTKARLYKDMGNGIAGGGIEYYLPLFFDETATIFDYLPARPRWCCTARWTTRCNASGPIRGSATASSRPTRTGRSCRPRTSSSRASSSSTRRGRSARCRCGPAAGVDDAVAWAVGPLPDVSVERGATAPMAACSATSPRRPTACCWWPTAKAGARRCWTCCATTAIEPISVGTLAEFEASDEKVAITAAPISEGFFWFEPEAASARTIQFITENELFATGATPRKRRRGQEQVSSVDALIKDLSELKLGDPVVHAATASAATWADQHRSRRRAERVPAPRIRRQGHAVRARRATRADQPLHRRLGRGGAAAQAGLGPVGQGAPQGRRAGARRRRRAAEPVRPARRARRLLAPFLAARLRGLRHQLRLRGDARPARRHPRGDPGSGQPQADGPARVRRRGLRQDRGRAARGLRRRARRQAGGAAGAHHAAGRAALPDHQQPLRPVAGEGGRDVALSHGQGGQERDGRAWPTAPSTSSWARTSCCRATSSSSAWAC
jgi:hypothetical protein